MPKDIATEPGLMGMTPEIAAAVCKVMSQVRKIGKGDHNKFDGYNFASVDAFFEFVNPLCAEAGLFVMHQETGHEFYENKKGSLWMRVSFDFYLCHSGGAICGPFGRKVAVPMTGAQSFGSAQSYALKQFLRGQFLIPTGEKDDADHNARDEHQAAPQRKSAPRQNGPMANDPALASEPGAIPPDPDRETWARTQVDGAVSLSGLQVAWKGILARYTKADPPPAWLIRAKDERKAALSAGDPQAPADPTEPPF